MLGIKAAVVGSKWIAGGDSWIEERRCGNASSMPLFPSLADANRFCPVRLASSPHLRVHQPQSLREKAEQQQSREKLRTSVAFTREIWPHKVEPSVLPWRRQFARKVRQ